MKKLVVLFCSPLLLLPELIVGQTATSITNGNWTNPFTWDCTCVPTDGYSVNINHNVSLNTSMVFNSGGITINSSGSLQQDASANKDIWINGGNFYSTGTFSVRYFLLSSGLGYNYGSFTVNAFSTASLFYNHGAMFMDSMSVSGSFTNISTGTLYGDSIRNTGVFANDGRMSVVWATNNNLWYNNNYQSGFSMTNLGVFENSDTLLLSNSFWNANNFWNKPNSTFIAYNDFFNTNAANNASFNNEGIVDVYDSWYNTDTVKGTSTGYFTVGDTSANSGFMKDSFDFCDLTPPASAPFVDLNSGTIDATITWCSAVGMKESERDNTIVVFPNPSNSTFSVKGTEKSIIRITDELGRVVYTAELNENNNFTLQISGLQSGIYFLSSGQKNLIKKISVSN
ncbi:MAG: T9SS type A sorting domain-containing protein [Bacteroidota bacterium]|nr:T9SS type A sorting domain-containing protein [Bacteroidota bacterium]